MLPLGGWKQTNNKKKHPAAASPITYSFPFTALWPEAQGIILKEERENKASSASFQISAGVDSPSTAGKKINLSTASNLDMPESKKDSRPSRHKAGLCKTHSPLSEAHTQK